MRIIFSKLNFSKYIQIILQRRWGRILSVVFLVAYFLVPIDVLPELITGPLGYIDDTALVLFVWNEYRKWRKSDKEKQLDEKTEEEN